MNSYITIYLPNAPITLHYEYIINGYNIEYSILGILPARVGLEISYKDKLTFLSF